MDQKRFFGLIVIAVGIVFLLPAIGFDVSAGQIFATYWPVVLLLLGVGNLFSSNGLRFSGVILILLGGVFLVQTTGFFDFEIRLWSLVLPLLLIVFGVRLLFSFDGAKTPSTKHFVRQSVLFSGADVRNNSQEFKGADLFAMFGGLDLDLREAAVAEDKPAMVDAFVMFGGIEVFVPEGWNVVVKGLPIFGGWDNKAKGDPTDEPDLIINATCMFAGMDIKTTR